MRRRTGYGPLMTFIKNRRIPLALFGVVAASLLWFVWARLDAVAQIVAGYKAKIACSEIFLAGRDADQVVDAEFIGIDPLMNYFGVRVDRENTRTIAAGPMGLGRSIAVYRDGYGCTLSRSGDVAALAPLSAAAEARPLLRTQNTALAGVIDDILRDAFADTGAGHRAVVVLQDGALVAERYADGFDETTPLLSWSMAKSITATLIGAAVNDGLIDIEAPAPVTEWSSDDPRATTTWRDLLQMQSGLEFSEDYGATGSDVNRMLWASADMGAVAAAKPRLHEPGAHWSYSSGTSNLLSRTLKTALDSLNTDYHQFGRHNIFNPIGAASVVMEPDASGAFVGSSFVYATARDWARLGQLYLQDGVWDGARLLPQGWAAFAAEPAAASDGQYGGHFWLNRDGENGRTRILPGLPEEAYYMSGHEGQFVLIVPSADLIIVRLGQTRGQNPVSVVAPMIERIYDAAIAP